MSAALALTDAPPPMTADQFASWEGGDPGLRYQLIDGEPVAMAPPSQTHGFLQIELARLLANHLLAIGSSCRVIGAPGVQPRIAAAINVRIPDLAVTCSSVADHYMANPVVAIEILSPSNQRETYEAIRAYTSLPSLREIVVLSSVRVAAEVFARQDDGTWPAEPARFGADAVLAIATFGFTCRLGDLYPTPT
jgi:Uma2 family endonuclease